GLRQMPQLGRQDRLARVAEVLREVGLDENYARRFPHELSGGQRQRVAIARAVVRRPAFVIADEPVSALDVTVRAQVLELFAQLQRKHGFSCLFISHDLSVVEQVADRVVVMQDGRIVEEGTRDAIFDHPRESYTRRLLSAIPALDANGAGGVRLVWRLNETAAKPGQRRSPGLAPGRCEIAARRGQHKALSGRKADYPPWETSMHRPRLPVFFLAGSVLAAGVLGAA